MMPRIAALVLLTIAPAMADNLDLAKRLVTDFGGVHSQLMKAGDFPPGGVKDAALYRIAHGKALKDDTADIAQLDAITARNLAANLTEAQLSQHITFWESPAGTDIAATLRAGGELTQTERAALENFGNSASDSGAAWQRAQYQTMMEGEQLFKKITYDAMQNYCHSGGDCSNLGFGPPKNALQH